MAVRPLIGLHLGPVVLALVLAAIPRGDLRAHVPHDTVVAVAAPADLDASAPWYLVADPYSISLLLRSDQAGRGWLHQGGEPVGDSLVGAAMLDDGTLTLLASSRLWWLEGDDWSWDELPGELFAVTADGDRLLLTGPSGLWSWTPRDGFAEELVESSFVLLGAGPVAVDDERLVWFLADGDWVAEEAPADPGAVLAADDLYLADMEGRVWRMDDQGWVACGVLPDPGDGTSAEIHRLAWDGERLVAAPGWRGPFVSEDRCESWIDRAVAGVPGADNFGQARTAVAVWTTLGASGDRWVIGGYFGVFLSEDAGQSWQEQPILSPAATRGLAFSPAYTGDQGVYWGTYAAGVAISHDDGASVVSPSHGLAEGNVQDVRTSDNGQEHVVTAVSGHVAYASHDAGQSWKHFQNLGGQAARIFPWDGGLEYWVIPYDPDEPLLESLDGGRSWGAPEALIRALDGAQPAAAARCKGTCGGAWRCLTAVNPTSLICSTDSGETWDVWYRADPGEIGSDEQGRDAVTEPVLMPLDEPEVVIFGDPSGLHRVSELGATWVDTPIAHGDVPVELACAAGDHAFAATRSGAILRSDDRGQSWIDLDLRLSSQATVMVSSPGFTQDAHLLVANLEGVFELLDPTGSPTLGPWTAWQRVDDRSGFVSSLGCPALSPDGDASMDSRQPLPEGCSLSVSLQGQAIRVLGISGTGSAGRLRIDGVSVASLPDEDPPGAKVLALVEGLEPGWHLVELMGEGNESLQIDAVESTGPEGFGPSDPPDARCACGHGRRGYAAALLALAIALLRRARRWEP